jgi:hypothetical protein
MENFIDGKILISEMMVVRKRENSEVHLLAVHEVHDIFHYVISYKLKDWASICFVSLGLGVKVEINFICEGL